MNFPEGQSLYVADVAPVIARGVGYEVAQASAIVERHAAAIFFDVAGQAVLKEIYEGLGETGFQRANLEAALSQRRRPRGWEVGEAVAQAFLERFSSCRFPWSTRRDQKNPFASATGVDLVGFQNDGKAERPHRFAFGEVKTSRQAKSPPDVVGGKHGLRRQMLNLRDRPDLRLALMNYLGYRAKGSNWMAIFKSAAYRLLATDSDFAAFGLLIRDVEVSPGDITQLCRDCADNCPKGPTIQLHAIYFPLEHIATWPDLVEGSNSGA